MTLLSVAIPLAVAVLWLGIALIGYCNILDWLALSIYQHSRTIRAMQDASRDAAAELWKREVHYGKGNRK